MYATLRNKTTGEFRDVDQGEFLELVKEVTPEGFPRWEQTSYAHASDVQEKATYGELLEEHMGEGYQKLLKHEALILDAEGVGPEHNPHLQLTPGEIHEGLTPEDKLEQLRQEYAGSVPKRVELEEKAHRAVAPEGKTQERQPSRGLRARAGGTEREGGPSEQAQAVNSGSNEQEEPTAGGSDQLTGEELKARAQELNIEGRSQMNADELREAVAKAEQG